MDRKIRVGAVSYLNTKPLVYGFRQGMMADQVDLLFDYPSIVAEKLLRDEVDLGLVPVALIPYLKEHHIVSDYCIGCDGEVASVCLFSDSPISEIKTVLLDYQSRTSVALLKILLKEHWKLSPLLIRGSEGFESEIKGTTAGLVIGDRAFTQRKVSKFIYDLGTAWKELTGLPFVFAAWISNKTLPSRFIEEFNETNKMGIDQLDEVIRQNPFTGFDLGEYYRSLIKFRINMPMREAITLFLSKLKQDE